MSLLALDCSCSCIVLAPEINNRTHLPESECSVHVTDSLTPKQAQFCLHKDEFQDYFKTDGENSARHKKMA